MPALRRRLLLLLAAHLRSPPPPPPPPSTSASSDDSANSLESSPDALARVRNNKRKTTSLQVPDEFVRDDGDAVFGGLVAPPVDPPVKQKAPFRVFSIFDRSAASSKLAPLPVPRPREDSERGFDQADLMKGPDTT